MKLNILHCLSIVFLVVSCSTKEKYPISAMTKKNSYIKITDRGKNNLKDRIILDILPKDEKSKKLIRDLWANYHEEFDSSTWVNRGPDSGYREIKISYNKQEITLQSWHPMFEKNINLVATSHGIESLEGRNRIDVLSEGPKKYLKLRNMFDEIFMKCQKHKGLAR